MADPRAGAAGAGVDPEASFPLPALPLELPGHGTHPERSKLVRMSGRGPRSVAETGLRLGSATRG